MKFVARLLILPVCLVFLFSFPAQAAISCNLDTSNPAITHMFLPIHGGSIQGKTGYSGPSEWVPWSDQGHWAAAGVNGMAFDDSLGLLNPATGHIHMELCMPNWADLSDSITVPFRMRAFHLLGHFDLRGGPMVRDVVFDNIPLNAQVPWMSFPGDPMGVVAVTGHLTFNLHSGDGDPNIHGAPLNGWTILMVTAEAFSDNGDSWSAQAESPVFSKLDPTAPINTGFLPNTAASNGVSSVLDGGSPKWGSQISEVRFDVLPQFGPFNTVWPVPHMFLYEYGGQIGLGTPPDVVCELRVGMDLHNGNTGRPIAGAPLNCNGPGFLDPQAISQGVPGVYAVTEVWQAKTGSTGIIDPLHPAPEDPLHFIGHPNQTATALLSFMVEVGPESAPRECLDATADNFGGQGPCVYTTSAPPPPPPPPPHGPVWTQGTIWTTPNGSGLLYHLCPALNPNDAACIVP